MAERPPAGFTLLEVLVALLVLSLAAFGLLSVLADATARDGRLRAEWRLAEAADLVWQSLRLGEAPPLHLLPAEFEVRIDQRPFDKELTRLVVEVRDAAGRSFRLTALRAER